MRVVIVACLAVSVMLASAFVLGRARGSDEQRVARSAGSAKPTYGQLSRIADVVEGDREFLVEQGIFLEAVGVGDGCVFVSLANPTAPNVAYMRRRYPRACVEPRPMGLEDFCGAPARRPTPRGAVRVPDVRDLGLAEASRRVLAAQLTFTTTCPGRERNVEWVPVNPPDELVRVVAQCPRAGERVPAATEIALLAKTSLPGGFSYVVGTAGECGARPG